MYKTCTLSNRLKGKYHEIFDPWVFFSKVPLGPLIHGISDFEYRFEICFNLTMKIDSALCRIARSRFFIR
jgi:hypothetical protein